jgi:hypothetical protein
MIILFGGNLKMMVVFLLFFMSLSPIKFRLSTILLILIFFRTNFIKAHSFIMSLLKHHPRTILTRLPLFLQNFHRLSPPFGDKNFSIPWNLGQIRVNALFGRCVSFYAGFFLLCQTGCQLTPILGQVAELVIMNIEYLDELLLWLKVVGQLLLSFE